MNRRDLLRVATAVAVTLLFHDRGFILGAFDMLGETAL